MAMKHTCVLFLLFVVCILMFTACHADILITTETTKIASADSFTKDATAVVSQLAEDTDAMSSVRTKLVYDRTVLTDKYPDLKTTTVFYFDNDLLYVQAQKNANGEQLLHVFDFTGERVNTLNIPEIKDGNVVYAHPLSDGGWVIGYKPASDSFSCRVAILDAEGTVLRQSEPMDGGALDGSYYYVKEEITEYGEKKLHILVHTWYGIHCYDRDLRESFIPDRGVPAELQFFVLNDGRYGVAPAIFTNGRMYDTVRPSDGEAKAYSIRLPKSLDINRGFRGADNRNYFADDFGMYLLDADRQPELVLEFGECGLNPSRDYINLMNLKIGNRNTFVNLEIGAGGALVLYRTESVPDDDQRQVIEIQSLHSITSPWMTEMTARFNRENPRYRVEIRSRKEMLIDSPLLHEQTQALLNEILLYERHPDMIFCPTEEAIAAHADKNIYVDLNELLHTELLSAIKECYSLNGRLYQIPFMFHMDTLAANPSVIAGDLTYDAFFQIVDEMKSGEVLAAMMPPSVYQNALMDFVDFENQSSTYHSETFHNVLRYIRNMNPALIDFYAGQLFFEEDVDKPPRYLLTNGTVSAALENGALKFLNAAFYNPYAYSALKLVFGDTPINLCGYPCLDGCGARIDSHLMCAVMQDTDVMEGCAEFLEFLLDTEQQTDEKLLEKYLPVSVEALRAALEDYRYVYYDKGTVSMLTAGSHTGELTLQAAGHSAEYLAQFDERGNTEDHYIVVETTDAEIDALMAFFDRCHMRANTDTVIKSIVEEEVSFWEGNARSLEETTKIIDSRVWIYLNE